jgi:hypothetical protein
VAFTAGTVGVLALAAGWLLGLFGLGPDLGKGPDEGSNASNPEETPARIRVEDLTLPMVVKIQQHDYYVMDQKVPLPRLVELAGQVARRPDASRGPAVTVIRTPSSRASAEKELIDALAEAGIAYSEGVVPSP